jgi:hypothetical protein
MSSVVPLKTEIPIVLFCREVKRETTSQHTASSRFPSSVGCPFDIFSDIENLKWVSYGVIADGNAVIKDGWNVEMSAIRQEIEMFFLLDDG